MMAKVIPVTVFCRDAQQALSLSAADADSRATVTGAGTMSFHKSIAEHGAGAFTTLYVPVALRGSFKPPIGGTVLYTEHGEQEPGL